MNPKTIARIIIITSAFVSFFYILFTDETNKLWAILPGIIVTLTILHLAGVIDKIKEMKNSK